MNSAIKHMLERYECRSFQEHEQALREILQEIALVGLWRGKFFEHAAFYGGTALRIFYGLDRFSEDLDFTLLAPNLSWNWQSFGDAIRNELTSFGFDVTFVEKEKKTQSAVKSAFVKTPTVQELLKIGVHSDFLKGVHAATMIRINLSFGFKPLRFKEHFDEALQQPNEVIAAGAMPREERSGWCKDSRNEFESQSFKPKTQVIKVEIDTNPPSGYLYEQKLLFQPFAVSIRCVHLESLFACKMHAALFRVWKGRVKGRDWYDIIWFIRKKVPLNLTLFATLTGQKTPLNHETFLNMAKERVELLDVAAAIEDIIHFVKDREVIERTWSKEFFQQWIEQVQTL